MMDGMMNTSTQINATGLSKETKEALSGSQRTMKKPPPLKKPKPVVPQKPANVITKPDANKNASLKRQISGPKPKLPARPPSLKRTSTGKGDPFSASSDKPDSNKIEGGTEAETNAPSLNERSEHDGQSHKIPPLLRTKSGPVKTSFSTTVEKPRASSVQEKENIVPKPLPRPKNGRIDSPELLRPVPPPRTKKNGNSKPIVQNDEDMKKVIDESASKVASMLIEGKKNGASLDTCGKATKENNSDDKNHCDTGGMVHVLKLVEEASTDVEVTRNNQSRNVLPSIPSKDSREPIQSSSNDLISSKVEAKATKRNPYENVSISKQTESSAEMKPSETKKRPVSNPYENVSIHEQMQNEATKEVIVEADEEPINSDRNSEESSTENEDSNDDNDYVNIANRNEADASLEYKNQSISNEGGLGETNIGLTNVLVIPGDTEVHGFSSNSDPMNFSRLRIDAEDMENEGAYVEMPRKGSQLCQSNGDWSPQSPQIEQLSQETHYQSPASSPKPSARRSLFGEVGNPSETSQKRIRRPPPQPPLIDKNSNVLRSKMKANELKFPSPAKPEVLQPTAKDEFSNVPDENIYVIPRSESVKDNSGADSESITSYQSAQSSVTDDFSHHIYKEPSVHSCESSSSAWNSTDSTSQGSNVAETVEQEYSMPGDVTSASLDDYVEPKDFHGRVSILSQHSNALGRSSYGESDSSRSSRSSAGLNYANQMDEVHSDDGYEQVVKCSPKMGQKARGDSLGYQSGPEYVDMSPAKEDHRSSIVQDYLEPMAPPKKQHPVRRPPVRPAPPAPIRPRKRPDNLPVPPVPSCLLVSEDLSKADFLDGRYERIQSLRREMGLPPIQKGEDFSDSESESDEELKGKKDEGKKSDAKEGDGKQRGKLYHIAHEILTTERTFVNALRLVCDEFANAVKQMMEKEPSSLSKHAFSQMFDDIELIYDLDQKFLQELEDRMKDWDSHNRIGDIVRKYGYFLKMYTNYIKGYDKAMSVFQESCLKMPKFAALVKEYERKPSFQNLKITSFMLKPIQRIPSYRLLLVDYLKHLPEDSEDHKDISNGLEIVSRVAKHINESMKEGDKFQTMLKLQARIINSKEIVKPGRHLIKEGILNKLSRKEAQERMFFLLTDCLLYCEHAAVSNQFKLKEELPLAEMRLDVPESISFNEELTIISTKRSFTVVASSKEERDEWAESIQRAIDDVSRKIGTFTIKLEHGDKMVPSLASPIKEIGHIAPNWVPDSRATMCCICLARFTTYNRRHHCRACGEIVCNACSSYEAPLPYLNFDAARVCEKCYEHLYERLVSEEEQNEETQEEEEKSRSKLKRSRSAISSKFKVIKKTKRPDRNARKTLPTKFTEVSAQEQECIISGFLFIMKKRKQKRRWFVLKDNALYSYKAPSDPAAHSTLAVLGYNVNVTGNFDTGDYVFRLEHSGLKEPFVYRADNRASAEMWVNALKKSSQLPDA